MLRMISEVGKSAKHFKTKSVKQCYTCNSIHESKSHYTNKNTGSITSYGALDQDGINSCSINETKSAQSTNEQSNGLQTNKYKLANLQEISNHYVPKAKTENSYSNKTKPPNFALHNKVMLRVTKGPTGLSPKLFEKYDGPYYITEVSPNFTYGLRRCTNHKTIKSLIIAARLVSYKNLYVNRNVEDEVAGDAEIPDDVDERGQADHPNSR